MEISNFSSLIEVGVTLNIACVAIEYAKSYTSTLCNQVFSLKSQIVNSCKECKDSLIDETTIRNIPNANVNGSDTDTVKERLISRRKTLISDIENKEKELKEEIKEVCEVKNISSICLWLSLFGLIGLFLMGFEDTGQDFGIHYYWTIMTFFTLVFIVVGWLIGNREKLSWKIIDYCSLRFSIFTFIICTILSTIVCFCVNYQKVEVFIEYFWTEILVFSMILIYSNFIASSIEVWNKAKKGQEKINNEKKTLIGKCAELNKTINSFEGLKTITAELTMDKNAKDLYEVSEMLSVYQKEQIDKFAKDVVANLKRKLGDNPSAKK